MSPKKPSIELDESLAAAATEAVRRRRIGPSARLDAATRRALVLEAGLHAVRDWEAEHGELSADELVRADGTLDACADRATRAIPVPDLPERVARDPDVMAGMACVRGTRVTVGAIVGQMGAGRTVEDVLADYPYLEREDVLQALRYAAGLAQGFEARIGRK